MPDMDEELAEKLLGGEGRLFWGTAGASGEHGFFDEITPQEALLIKPRYQKTREEKKARTGAKAEVFTPLSTVAEINMSLWQGERATAEARWLEACCGEGAFITTRYDALTGEEVPPEKRMGFLDMKLRLPDADPLLCLKSCFGFEWQGDSLFLARKNVLLTYLEAAGAGADIDEACRVIRTHLFQMDGISWRKPDLRFDVRTAKQKMKKPGALEGYCSSLGLKKVQIP